MGENALTIQDIKGHKLRTTILLPWFLAVELKGNGF
jgi:hypothetical protein